MKPNFALDESTVLQHCRSLFKRLLRLNEENLGFVDIAMCVCVASAFQKNTIPLWVMGQGKKGSTKTELLRTLKGFGDAEEEEDGHMYFREAFSEKGMVSGFHDEKRPDVKFSLLPELDGKSLLIHEFAAINKMPENQLNQLGSQFSGVYDADDGYAKQYGTGVQKAKSFFGSLICSAQIDRFLIYHNVVGSRFLVFRLFTTKEQDKALTRVAMRAMVEQSKWREEMLDLVKQRVKPLRYKTPEGFPFDRPQLIVGHLPEPIETSIVEASSFCAKARSLPPSIQFTQNPDIIGLEELGEEVATRLAKQLAVLGWTRAYIDGRMEWDDADLALVHRVCWDTIPVVAQKLLVAIKSGKEYQAGPLAERLGIHVNQVRAIMRQYEELELVRHSRSETHVHKWALLPETAELLEEIWEPYKWWPRTTKLLRLEDV